MSQSHGVFEKHFTNKIAKHKKGHASVLLATDGVRWYWGYDFRCNEGAGGRLPSTRESFATREQAAERSLKSIKHALQSHLASGTSKTSKEIIRALLKQIAIVEGIHHLHTNHPPKKETRMPAQTREKSSIVSPNEGNASQSEQIVSIPLEKLRDHPGNPESTEAEIIEMMQWLQEGQQDEPITVRPLADPIGHYEVLAGKRRKAAATRLGWDSLQARIRRDLADDMDAAAFAARNNIERRTEGDLRKAHWLRYQVEQLGMTVGDAASAMGMSQGAASNLMAIAEMCDRWPYWRERLIAGEMSAAHLRPIKKYRDYPPVMKLLEKHHRELVEYAKRGASCQEKLIMAYGTRESVEYTIESLLEYKTGAWTVDDMIGDEGMYRKPKCDVKQLTPAQIKKLKVVSIPAPGDKTDRMVSRCFDAKQWQILQAAANNNSQKKAADKASRSGGTGSASKQRTPAEQKLLDETKAKQLKERIRHWRHDWLKGLVADRLQPALWHKIRTWSTRVRLSDVHYDEREHAWASIAGLTDEQLDEYDFQHVRALLTEEDRNPKWPRLKWSHVDSLAEMAGIDVAREWRQLQANRTVRFETFFLLHDISQLERLAGELKVNVEGLIAKKQLVARLTSQHRVLPLPKSIAPLKPAGKVRKKK